MNFYTLKDPFKPIGAERVWQAVVSHLKLLKFRCPMLAYLKTVDDLYLDIVYTTKTTIF